MAVILACFVSSCRRSICSHYETMLYYWQERNSAMYRMVDLITKKRDGGSLTTDEIGWFIKTFTAGDVPDYQASALAMEIYFCGMSPREIADLTLAMAHSGDVLDLSGIAPVG